MSVSAGSELFRHPEEGENRDGEALGPARLDGPAASLVDGAGVAVAPGHVECGEERFVVSFEPETGEVTYEIAAFSRPATLLAKLGYPLARRLQHAFARASARTLSRIVNGPAEGL